MNLEWGLDATNVLNRVSYRSVNVLAGSPQFGLPVGTNNPRKIVGLEGFGIEVVGTVPL